MGTAAAAAAAAAVALQQSHAAILANQCRVCSASAIISESMAVALAWAAAAAAGMAWRRLRRSRGKVDEVRGYHEGARSVEKFFAYLVHAGKRLSEGCYPNV